MGTNCPDIPEFIINNKDKKALRGFMEESYDRKLDGRLGWPEALKQSREAIRIAKRTLSREIKRQLSNGAPVNAKYQEFLSDRAEMALEHNRKVHHMYEEDTSKWLWDDDRVEWVGAGLAPGTCKIKLKANQRVLAVTRETAGIFLDLDKKVEVDG